MIVDLSTSVSAAVSRPNLRDPRLGYYRVGDTVHANKVPALLDGTRRNIHPEWRFNNEVFDHWNWTVEPLESLDELYRQRAQELRDRYDYFVLMYSGGSDCDNILHTCLKHKIHIDEIVTSFPISAPGEPNPNDYSEYNVKSEWYYCIQPKLDWIAKNHPKIKITVNDWAKTVQSFKIADDYLLDCSHNVSPYSRQRWSFDLVSSILNAVDKKSTVGIIRGVEKPKICFHNNAYRLYFLDIPLYNNMIHDDDLSNTHHVGQESFYWSPDSCKILTKQAHALVNFFESVPNFRTYVTWPTKSSVYRQWYETSTRAIIYPELDLNFFQVAKPGLHQMNGWDRLISQMDLLDVIINNEKENRRFLEANVDHKYFNDLTVSLDFVGFISGMYPIKIVNPHT